ncbi:MAG: adenosylmethionine--8-amino-7-oxononanoate transaminase [Leptospirillum sp.]
MSEREKLQETSSATGDLKTTPLPDEKLIQSLRNMDRQTIMHPFTPLSRWEQDSFPIITGASGSYLIDEKGNRFLDGTASLWVNLLGHKNPAIDQAIRDQLEQWAHSTFLGLSHEPGILLAKELLDIAPNGLTKVFFSDNGSTAVEAALKLAYLSTPEREKNKRPSRFLSFSQAYHGDTLGAVGVGGIDRFHQEFGPILVPSIKVPAPDCFHCPSGLKKESCHMECFDLFKTILTAHRDETCAVICEPLLQAAGGMIVWPPGYLKKIRELTLELDIPLIADEVATGFGRAGAMFACNLEEVSPDFLCLGKGLTGGYLPLAATLMTDRVYESVKQSPGAFFHGHSFTANPLGAAAARATLSQLKDLQAVRNVREKNAVATKVFTELATRYPGVRNFRSLGLIVAMDLYAGETPFSSDKMEALRQHCHERGLIIRPLGHIAYLFPPLSVSMAEWTGMCRILGESIMACYTKQ